MNDSYIDHELLTLTKATVETRFYGSNVKFDRHNVTFDKEEDIEIELHSLGQAAGFANGNVTFPLSIASPAHFQQVQGCFRSPKTFRMYNQLNLNIPLELGDSGSGIYIQNYVQTGCLGMAIAFFNGMSVVTPMKTIVNKLN